MSNLMDGGAGEKPATDAIAEALAAADKAAPAPAAAIPAETPAQAPAAQAPATPAATSAATPPASDPAATTPAEAPDVLKKRLDDSQAFIKQLQDERRQDALTLQNMLKDQGTKHNEFLQVLRDQTEALKPKATAEEREAEAQRLLVAFNSNPQEFLANYTKTQTDALLKRVEELEGKTGKLSEQVAPVEIRNVQNQQLQRLAQTMPETATEEFRAEMFKKEITDKVYHAHFEGQAPEDVMRNPTFYSLVAMEVKLAAKAAFSPTLTQAEKDKQTQASVAKGQGGMTPPGGPAGAAPKPVKSQADQIADEIIGAQKPSFHNALEEAFKK